MSIIISIHAPLAGSDQAHSLCRTARSISIHAPLAGSDERHGRGAADYRISIHAPLAGSDRGFMRMVGSFCYFNPRSPRGERPPVERIKFQGFVFQSTLPSRGATKLTAYAALPEVFQSTLPSRGATGSPLIGTRTKKRFQSTLPSRGATGRWPF